MARDSRPMCACWLVKPVVCFQGVPRRYGDEGRTGLGGGVVRPSTLSRAETSPTTRAAAGDLLDHAGLK